MHFSIKKNELIKNLGKPHDGNIVNVIAISDNENIFSHDNKGSLTKWSISKGTSSDFGILNKGNIGSIASTKDAKWLFIGDHNGFLTGVSIETEKISKFGKVLQGGIWA